MFTLWHTWRNIKFRNYKVRNNKKKKKVKGFWNKIWKGEGILFHKESRGVKVAT